MDRYIYIFKNTYEGITLETVKDILSEEHITWREVKKAASHRL